MTYRILTKKSNVAGTVPHSTELAPGELALNYSDMILYALDADGLVQPVSSGSDDDSPSTDYTFWVKVVQEGQSLVEFEGPDDTGSEYDVNLDGFDVALNGFSLIPTTDYGINETRLTLGEPAEPGDVVIIRSLNATSGASTQGVLTTNDIALLGEDTTQPAPTGYEDWLTRNNLKTQQDANWHLLHKIDDLEIPEGQDLSAYETITNSEAGDSALQTQIDALSASGGYNDAWIQPAIDAGDDTTLADAKAHTDQEIAAIPPTDLSAPATKKEVTDGDAKSLTDSKKYTDDKIDAIVFPPGTIVKDSEPPNAPNGTNWFDTVRLELFVRASETWVPSSPLGARISQGEIVQAELVDRVTTIEQSQSQPSGDVDKAYVDAQDATKIGNTGEQTLPTSTWKLRARKVDDSGNYSYLAIQDDSLKLYHVADPTAAAHGMSRGYADGRYQFIQKPIGFKSDQSVACTMNPVPSSGEFCGLNNSSPGSSTSANNYFGNFNAGIRVHTDKLLNPEGNKFEVMERYNIAGTVSIFGKDTNKLYFRQGVTAVVRDSSHEYVALVFSTRVPTFGTGATDAESKYIVIVDGLTSSATNTTLVPEGADEE